MNLDELIDRLVQFRIDHPNLRNNVVLFELRTKHTFSHAESVTLNQSRKTAQINLS